MKCPFFGITLFLMSNLSDMNIKLSVLMCIFHVLCFFLTFLKKYTGIFFIYDVFLINKKRVKFSFFI